MLTLAYAVALDQFHSLFFAGNSFFFFFCCRQSPLACSLSPFSFTVVVCSCFWFRLMRSLRREFRNSSRGGAKCPGSGAPHSLGATFFFFNVFCNSQLEKKMQLCLPAMRRSTHAVKWVVVYWVNKKYKSTNFAWKKFTQHTGCILYIGLYNDLPLIADILPRKLIWRSPSAAPMEIIGTALRILSTNEPRRQVVDF